VIMRGHALKTVVIEVGSVARNLSDTGERQN
jgi:hypothetical protein